MSAVATASRQMFAFARDRCLPFSNFLCRVGAHTGISSGTFADLPVDPPWLGHPTQRPPGILRRHLPLVAHQPWLFSRAECYPIPHSRRHPQLLHSLHQSCGPPEDS